MKKLMLAALLVAAPLAAQQPQQPRGEDMFGKYLFPPELVMQRQADIGLRDAQRTQITNELQKAQQTMTDVQWRLAAEAGKMEKLLQTPVVDEARVLAQVDSILALEREIKRAQITLLVRIRNTLTEEQRARLGQLRERSGS